MWNTKKSKTLTLFDFEKFLFFHISIFYSLRQDCEGRLDKIMNRYVKIVKNLPGIY